MTMPVVEANPTVRVGMDEQRHAQNLVILFAESVGRPVPGEADNRDAAGEPKGHHNDLATDVIRKHHGQVIKTIGASVMAEFADPATAVRAAVEMERLLMESPQDFSQCEQPGLRIGIHGLIGDCQRIDLFGGVVHVAASITKNAASGQILTSREVCDALSKETDLHFQWFRKVTVDGQAQSEDIFEVHWATAPTGIPSRYEAAFQVGTGGMGIVYKARDRETGEIVALKVLRSDIAADPAMQENLRREVCLARKVTHKNVCRIHEFNRSNGIAYISMEFVEGASLLSTLQRSGRLPWNEALKIMRQVCAGLGEAHAQGIVHRDLKPANIMMDRSGVAKIMDFGIARSLQGTGQMTGTLVGTPAYMAPEQVELKGVDARTDVYALGLLLYEIVTGSQAFEGEPPIAVALKQLREFPTRPREIVPSLPAHAEAVILKCMQKDPSKRFQSMDELAAAFRNNAPAKPAVSLWSSFVTDVRCSGRDLYRDLQPRVEAVGEFFRREGWKFLANRQDWTFLRNKRTQKALAVGLSTACLLAGLVFFTLRSTRNNQVVDSASIGSSAAIAIQNWQLPFPKTIAAEDLVGLATKPLGSASAADAAQPVTSYQADPASGAELGSREKSPSDLESSTQGRSKSKGTRVSKNQKTRPVAGVSEPPLAVGRAATPPVATQTQTLLPPDVVSTAPVTKTSASSEQKSENAHPDLSASLLPTTPPATPSEAAVDAKTTDGSPALPASYLEVGSFKESTWADHAVEELTQLGFHAVSVHKTLLWRQSYQVRVGPYTDSKNLEVARRDLVSQGFKPHLVN
jgi:serine/threonine protein kinase/class 3 adenylate cyclase